VGRSQAAQQHSTHGIDFNRARVLFDGRPTVDADALSTIEQRFRTTGELDGRLVTAIWTQRAGVIHLISVRSARDAAERAYRSLHGG
jgi:uncharacterized DUF497 family protein